MQTVYYGIMLYASTFLRAILVFTHKIYLATLPALICTF